MANLVRRLGLSILLTALTLLTAGAVGGPAHADRVTATQDDVTMELRKDGVLHVAEKIKLSGGPLRRTLLTRTRYDNGNDRVYRVENVRGATFDGTTMTISGSGTVEYDVRGAVTPLSGGEELRWYAVAGPAEHATVTVSGPGRAENISCFAGEPASAIGCTGASIDETGATSMFEQQGLRDGEMLTIVVGYPKGATGAGPILERRFELANAFTLNMVTGGALALLLLVLCGGIGLLYWTRGRDARVVGARSGMVVGHQNGQFAPPNDVRPGQIGTLIDEQADVIDVTATIVDLAVRGYLRIDEQPRQAYDAPDWLLVRMPSAPVASLLPYERALYDAVFEGRDAVLLSQLQGSFTTGLSKVRDGLYRDMVTQGWFARRPDSVRTRWTTVGVIAAVLGVVVTVALAWFTTYALLGLALIIAGAALAVGGQYMPAKTSKGATVLAQTLGFREHLMSGEIGDIPPAQRIELFSRYLPYAVVFDSVDRWARVVASIHGDGRPADNLYWYQGPAEWDLSKFADSMRTFTMTTSGAISAARLFRSF
ncbi:DUF2207 domain-containing protein [Microtetraspora malaysiensis]|uniref:DUF2207 domain-containing protein n=1 Tax=Microtetraspora malaysiensis TaxID=161358 RepID=A0ABW6SGN6_9ACTN